MLAQSTTADVRYANAADEGLARRVRDRVQGVLDQAGHNLQVELLFIGGTFKNVPRGTIEVWLPPLAPLEQKADMAARQRALPNAAR